jgi:hypothetical protein
MRPTPTPHPPEYFDYNHAASSAQLTGPELAKLIERFERDYPADLMLRELHILRACNAIAGGRATLNSIVSSSGPESSAA